MNPILITILLLIVVFIVFYTTSLFGLSFEWQLFLALVIFIVFYFFWIAPMMIANMPNRSPFENWIAINSVLIIAFQGIAIIYTRQTQFKETTIQVVGAGIGLWLVTQAVDLLWPPHIIGSHSCNVLAMEQGFASTADFVIYSFIKNLPSFKVGGFCSEYILVYPLGVIFFFVLAMMLLNPMDIIRSMGGGQ